MPIISSYIGHVFGPLVILVHFIGEDINLTYLVVIIFSLKKIMQYGKKLLKLNSTCWYHSVNCIPLFTYTESMFLLIVTRVWQDKKWWDYIHQCFNLWCWLWPCQPTHCLRPQPTPWILQNAQVAILVSSMSPIQFKPRVIQYLGKVLLSPPKAFCSYITYKLFFTFIYNQSS